MVYLKKLLKYIKISLFFVWSIITWPYNKIKEEIAYRKKIKELRKKDPFIYK